MVDAAMEEPTHRALGQTDEEFDRIRDRLEREPNHLELAMYSDMWYEQCSDHMTEYMASSRWLGSRSSLSRMRSNSSSVSPSAR